MVQKLNTQLVEEKIAEERRSGNKKGRIRDKEEEEDITGYGRGSEAGGGSNGTQ